HIRTRVVRDLTLDQVIVDQLLDESFVVLNRFLSKPLTDFPLLAEVAPRNDVAFDYSHDPVDDFSAGRIEKEARSQKPEARSLKSGPEGTNNRTPRCDSHSGFWLLASGFFFHVGFFLHTARTDSPA